jgi:hypothetical protein
VFFLQRKSVIYTARALSMNLGFGLPTYMFRSAHASGSQISIALIGAAAITSVLLVSKLRLYSLQKYLHTHREATTTRVSS